MSNIEDCMQYQKSDILYFYMINLEIGVKLYHQLKQGCRDFGPRYSKIIKLVTV